MKNINITHLNWHYIQNDLRAVLLIVVSYRSLMLIMAVYALVCLTWGTTWMGIKLAVETVPPLTAAGLRFLIAFPPLLVFAQWRGEPLRFPKGHSVYFSAMVLGYFCLPFFLINYGERHVSSGLAALLFSSMPLYMLIFAAILLRERIHWRQILGIGLGFYALAMVIQGEGLDFVYDQKLGMVAILLAAMMHAACYIAAKKYGSAISPVTFNTLPIGIAGVLLSGAGFVLERPDLAAMSSSSLFALLYLGLVASVVGFLAYFYLLKRLGPVALSFVFLIFPVLSIVLDHVVEGTQFSASFPYFASLLLLGFALTKLPQIHLRIGNQRGKT